MVKEFENVSKLRAPARRRHFTHSPAPSPYPSFFALAEVLLLADGLLAAAIHVPAQSGAATGVADESRMGAAPLGLAEELGVHRPRYVSRPARRRDKKVKLEDGDAVEGGARVLGSG